MGDFARKSVYSSGRKNCKCKNGCRPQGDMIQSIMVILFRGEAYVRMHDDVRSLKI